MRLVLLLLLAFAAVARPAAAECKKRAVGKPLYTEERGPLHPPADGESTPVQTQTFTIHASGTWTWVGAGEAGSGEAMGRSGCIAPAALRELTRALGRARFRPATEPVAVCQAVPIARVVYAAPRRGKRITGEEPCGRPFEPATHLLIDCAHAVMNNRADLRATCRGGS